MRRRKGGGEIDGDERSYHREGEIDEEKGKEGK